ncbi:hypothetical protein CsSME_00042010 [Camellia sinensis var. sinensis]
MDSSSGNERFSHKVVEVETENNRCNQGQKDDLHAQLWHACAGPLVNVPRAGDKVFYFPQGHIEQVEAYSNQDGKVEMPIYDLPSKILCKVVYVQLKAEPYTDEVFAQITLLPEGPSPEHRTSQCQHQKINACSFRKRLTPSDQSTHGGFSVPKRYADECFPPLDMSQEPPTQELVAKDLHGSEWRFRHIYRGHPKRHLLSSGWSTFVSAKKLVVGDACIFLRGENGELYVGVRRATKSQISIPASVISGVSMQHGILASAFHAVSTGTMFTVYYRPWTSPAEFIIPYDRYMKSAENDYSIGTRFSMQFDGEECPEPKCSIFAGTVVGIDNIDCIRWPGSEWRCLKVQWDAPSKKIVRPQRISHWNIEPEEVKKKCSSILTDRKRERPLDPSTPGFTVLVSEGLSKGSVEHPPKRQLEVLQGQENRAIDAHEFGALRQPLLSHLIPQPNPDWGHPQIGLENQPHFLIGDAHEFGALRQPLLSHLIPQLNPDCGHPQIGLENQPHFLIGESADYWSPTFTSSGAHDSVEVSRSLSFPKFNSTSSVSVDCKAPEEYKIKAPLSQPNGNAKCMLFGVNIFSSPLELPSQQVVSCSDLHSVCPALPVVSHSSISETDQVSETSKSVYGNLSEKQCKNCCSITGRSCTKVLKYGTVLGRSVHLARFDDYDELIRELDQMFDFKGSLIDGSNGWHVTYTDGKGNMMLIGDYPWLEFRVMVQKMFICPKEDVDKLDPTPPNPTPL